MSARALAAPAGAAGRLAALAGAGAVATVAAVALARTLPAPAALAVALASAPLALIATRAAARLDPHTAWLACVLALVPAGEIAAIALGGQSGRLLWVDVPIAIGAAVALVAARGRIAVPRAPLLLALLPLIGWSALTLPFARDPLTGIAELKEWMVAAVAAALALGWTRNETRARRLLAGVALTGALVAALMWIAALRHPLGPAIAVMMKLVDLPWGRTNYLAGILILTLPLALGLLGHAATARARLGWGAVAALTAGGLALSASKGAMLAFLLAALVAYLPARGSARAPRLLLAATVALATLAFVAGPLRPALEYRMQLSALDYSASERMDLYRLAIEQALRHPVLGLGLNNFSVAANPLRGVDTVPHNYALGFAAELGIVGLALALAWAFALLASAWRVRAAARTAGERTLAAALMAAVLAAALHNQFESTIYGEQFKLLLVLTAVAMARLERDFGARAAPAPAPPRAA